MATYHLHAKTWSRGAGKGAGGHVRYIQRIGPYAKKIVEIEEGSAVLLVEVDRASEVVCTLSGNMPSWAEDPVVYWDAADEFERAKGTVYREIEFSLPEEFDEQRSVALAQEFAEVLSQTSLGPTPYTLAIHRSEKDSELLHCHLMLSDKVNDGHDRTPGLWFKQAADKKGKRAKPPEQGGAPKTQERISQEWLGEVVRPLWERLANEELEQAGHSVRIDHRTLDAQRQEQERLAEEALARGDEVAAARYQKAARVLDRPPQPKRGRVLEHGGPEAAPGQARLWEQYERELMERQAAVLALEAAEQEQARYLEALERERQRLAQRDALEIQRRWEERQRQRAARARREAARREFAQSHRKWELDRLSIAWAVSAMVAREAERERADIRRRWEDRQRQRPEERHRRILERAEERHAHRDHTHDHRLWTQIRWQGRQWEREQRAEWRREQERLRGVAELLEGCDPNQARSFDRRVASLRDAVQGVDRAERQRVRSAAAKQWEAEQIQKRPNWVRAAASAGGWEVLRERWAEQRQQESGGLLAWTPNRRKKAQEWDDRLRALEVLLEERRAAMDAAERGREAQQEQAVAAWERLSPHLEAARAEFTRQRAAIEAEREKQRREEQERKRQEVAERDRDTERERGPGIRHPDKPRWWRERERMLTQAYGRQVADALGRWYRVERQEGALVLSNAQARVTDYGDRVTAAAGNDREIEALVLLAQSKGWQTVALTGSAEFQERAGVAFVDAGIPLADKELAAKIQAKIEARQREEQERMRREAERKRKRQESIEQESAQARAARKVWEEQTLPRVWDAHAKTHVPWVQWRDLSLAERYGKDLAAKAEAENWYTRMRPDLGGLDIQHDGREVIDTGVMLKPDSDRAIPLLLDLARTKGWKSLGIGGPESFQLAAAKAALKAGFELSDKALQAKVEIEVQKPSPPQRMVQVRKRGPDLGM